MPRRLPVIQTSAAEDEVAASRPTWHWVLIGAGLTVTLWAPLVAIATPLGLRLASHVLAVPIDTFAAEAPPRLSPRQATLLGALVSAPLLLAFAIAGFGAGALVGRFGGRARAAHAALGAAGAGCLASSLALVAKGGISWASFAGTAAVLAVVGALGGFLGGSFGFRKRPC
ncbi:MAG TPA: hypothetical protein VF395_03245 [Polyangiaceae bacterium]